MTVVMLFLLFIKSCILFILFLFLINMMFVLFSLLFMLLMMNWWDLSRGPYNRLLVPKLWYFIFWLGFLCWMMKYLNFYLLLLTHFNFIKIMNTKKNLMLSIIELSKINFREFKLYFDY